MADTSPRSTGRRSFSSYAGAAGGVLGAFAWPATILIILFTGFGGLARSDASSIERWADLFTVILFILGLSVATFPLGILGIREPGVRMDGVLRAAIALGAGALVAAIVVGLDRPTLCDSGSCHRILGYVGSLALFGGVVLGALTNIATGIALDMSAPPGRPPRTYRIVRTLLVVGGAIVLLGRGGLLFALISTGGTIVLAAGGVAAAILMVLDARRS